MKTTRYSVLKLKRPYLVIVCAITIWSFLFVNMVQADNLRPPLGHNVGSQDSLGMVAESQPGNLRPLAKAERRTDEVAIYHHNLINVDFTLPPDRFGIENINILDILLSVLVEELGYVPIVSVIGSLSYAVKEGGTLDWDAINDFDLRMHTRETLTRDQKIRINTRYLEELRRRAVQDLMLRQLISRGKAEEIVPVDVPDSYRIQYGGIYEKTRSGKHYKVQLIFASEGDLLKGGERSTDPSVYKRTDLFFGDTERLNQILERTGLVHVLRVNLEFYENLADGINVKLKTVYPDGSPLLTDDERPALLKSVYQLAYLIGKGAEYRWLLTEYRELSLRYDNGRFWESFNRAFRELGHKPRRLLILEFLKVFAPRSTGTPRAEMFNAVAKSLLGESELGPALDAIMRDTSLENI